MATIRAADGGYLLNSDQFNYTKDTQGRPVLNVVGGGGGTDESLGITGAAAGKIPKIKAVDAAGKPTEWEAAESIDKALYVVNATMDFDSFKLSVDKTFAEIKQAYDEGKYSIVLSLMGTSITPLSGMSSEACVFVKTTTAQQDIVSVTVDTVIITKDNVVETYSDDLATTTSKLPNPNALTFTGAVTGIYDGSEPMTVEIPKGVPPFTDADNDKVLGIVNGALAWVTKA